MIDNSRTLFAKKLAILLEKPVRDLYMFCGFWILVSLLALLQDFLNAQWNGNYFSLWESLSYKFFWLLFIPFGLFQLYTINRITSTDGSKLRSMVAGGSISIVNSMVHLLIFSLFLVLVSQVIHKNNHWQFTWLLQEKLATRLYVAISVYVALTYYWNRASSAKPTEEVLKTVYPKMLPVKNGSRSTMVDTNSIKWIKSDGSYLELYTEDKRHVIIGSLKHLLTTLDPEQFSRIHKSTIVNTGQVLELRSRLNGDYDVTMTDGTVLRLSRNYSKNVRGILL